MASVEMDSTTALGAVVNGSNQFLSRLYPALVEANGQGNDLVMSLFSVTSVLAMAYVGAKGNTREEMKQVLFFPSEEEINLGYHELFRNLKSSPNFTLDVANNIFIQDKYPFLYFYIEQLKNYFLAEPTMVDFAKSEEVRKTINTWVEQKTHNKITDLIPPGTLDYHTRAVLVNAVYFKGTWVDPFDKRHTHASKFHISPTETVDVEMMHITGGYKVSYSKELGCAILDMPYKGDRLSMLFFLSEEPEGFDEMEKKIYSVNMSSISSVAYWDNCVVEIPKFKVETTHQLVKPLMALGLSDMLDKTRADFSGMTGKKNLYVSSVIQKAFIEVNEEGNEEGSEATVSNCMVEQTISMPTWFICDRPFLFAIKDNLSGMILFNGRVVNPTVQQQNNNKNPTGTSSGARGLGNLMNFNIMLALEMLLCTLTLMGLYHF